MTEVAIVGGGILGMTLALRLSAAGHRVTVLEGAAAAGGLVAPEQIGGFTWDRFYHVMLESDAHLAALLDELGLSARIVWNTTRTGFYTDGSYHSMSNAWEFLQFPPLGLWDKARLAGTILRASRIRDSSALESVTVESWLRRWSGDRTFEKIWKPLLEAKLGANWRRVSAAFIWAIIARMYAARRSGLKRERFGYVEGGYDTVLRALRAQLETNGVALRTGAPVRQLQSDAAGVRLAITDGTEFACGAAVLTVPASRIAGICPQLAPEEKTRLGLVAYQGVICASLLLDRPLAGYYVTNITDAGFPFTTVIEMTALVGCSTFGGHTLAYLPRYCVADDPWWEKGDEEVRALFLAGLRRLHPDLPESAVRAFVVSRAREVQALATMQYSSNILPPVRTSLPNVFVVNSAQIVNGTLNSNESIGLANSKALELLQLIPLGAAR